MQTRQLTKDLASATKSFDADQANQFEAFSRSFLIAIQDSESADEHFDEGEIDRFRRALTLTRVTTRVTAVGEEASPDTSERS